jgi:membrane protein YdbS with pleckstrin-like domain
LAYFTGHVYVTLAAVAVCIYKYLEVNYCQYLIYEDHMTERKGVLNVTEETVNYFRIKSIMVEQPFIMRLVGLSIVRVTTSEAFKVNFVFHGVTNGDGIQAFLQQVAKDERKKLGIRELDIYG